MSETNRSIKSLDSYLTEVKSLVLDEMKNQLPLQKKHVGNLYEIMLDYPSRGGKALRPALCIAMCRALGGPLRASLHTATILEMYHNAFLIHDDVQDGSEERRHQETLHTKHGSAIAINVGDGMLALCIKMMLQNASIVGLGKTLRIIETISQMSQETAEGQMIELQAVKTGAGLQSKRDYVRMVHKKTAWYSFIAPLLIGAMVAGADARLRRRLYILGTCLGVAFQIKDDLLNLEERPGYGKEINGDIWEGKFTLMLIFLLERASSDNCIFLNEFLAKPRAVKTEEEVHQVREWMGTYACLEDANAVAMRYAQKAEREFSAVSAQLGKSVHSRFLEDVIEYVLVREL